MDWWKVTENWYDRNLYCLFGNSSAYIEKWVVTHFSKFLVNKRKNLVKKIVRLCSSRTIGTFTVVNNIQFWVYIMLLIDRLMGVILLEIDSIFWYFAGQFLHSHTIFQLHSTPPNYSLHPNNPLIPTIFPFSAILLPYLYSKLPSHYLSTYSCLFSTSLHTSTHTPCFTSTLHLANLLYFTIY